MNKQFIISLGANVSRVALGFIFFWQVSQALGLKTLGEYLYITAALGYFGAFIDFGFNLFVINTASRSATEARPLFLRVVLSKVLLTIFSASLLLALYGVAFADQGVIVTILFFIVLVLQSFSGLFIHFYKALGRFDHEFASTVIGSALPVLMLLAVGRDLALFELALMVLFVRVLVILLQLALFQRVTAGQRWLSNQRPVDFLPDAVSDIWHNAKYGVFSVLGTIFVSIDLVVMRFVLGPEEVSLYGTAMKIILASILFFEVLQGTFIPRLARSHETDDRSEFWKRVRRFSLIMFICAAGFSLGMAALGPMAVNWAFGEGFAISGEIVRVLAVVFIFRIMEMITGPILTVYGLQNFRARAMVVMLPFHIGGNLLLQTYFGVWGAAYALGLSFFMLFILNFLYLSSAIKSGWSAA